MALWHICKKIQDKLWQYKYWLKVCLHYGDNHSKLGRCKKYIFVFLKSPMAKGVFYHSVNTT
jgi:hypothetical protein